jgi:hypothetical protein
MSTTTTPVTVDNLLSLSRDIHGEIDINETSLTSDRSKHLIWVADEYNHLAELLRQYPATVADIAAAADLLGQAREMEPDRGGRAALNMARTRGHVAATAGKNSARN